MNDRPSRAGDVFARALEQPAERRLEFVRRATRGDDALRAEVVSLLRAHAGLGAFLDADRAPPPGLPPEPAPDAVPGHWLIRKIGEGGYGTVHLAEERGDLPRRVAVKFLKLAVCSPAALARFATERRVLAGLQHDAIARIFTSGNTAAGCPYYTMEYVDGPPIDRHCDARRLDVRDRVALLLPVCRGVAHAHQRGVIHGDLKPQNVLVCSVDDRPSPKVIDFGIARVLGGPIEPRGARAGTPRYMAPELLTATAADTRADVFGLGVMLFELLVDRPEGAVADLSPRDALRRRDPAQRAQIAALRSATPRQLARRLAGDLDAIVGRATAADPELRHQTVGELIADLDAWLASRPVPSRGRRPIYVLSRFVNRHRLAVWVIALGAVIAAAIAARAAESERRERVARAVAAQAAQRSAHWAEAADDVLGFLDDVILAATPGRDGRDVRLLEVIEAAERRLDAGEVGRPLTQARLVLSLGRAWSRIGDAQRAEALFRRTLTEVEAFAERDERALAVARVELGRLLASRGATDEARALLAAVLAGTPEARAAVAELPATAVQARVSLAFADFNDGRVADYLRGLRDAHGEAERRLAAAHPLRVATLVQLIDAEREYGDAARAEALLAELGDRSIAPAESLQASLRPALVAASNHLTKGDLGAATEAAAGVLAELERRGLGAVPNRSGIHARTVLAQVAQRERRSEDALGLTREVFDARVALDGPVHARTINAARNVAAMLVNLQRDAEALEFLERHTPAVPGDGAHDDLETAELLSVRAVMLRRGERTAEALACHDRIVAAYRAALGPTQRRTLEARLQRAGLLVGVGRTVEGLDEMREVHALLVDQLGRSHVDTLVAAGRLVWALSRAGSADGAERLVRDSFALALAAHGPAHPATMVMLETAVGFSGDSGRADVALDCRVALESAFDRALRDTPEDAALTTARDRYRERFPTPLVGDGGR